MEKNILANAMLGLGAIIATALQMATIGIFFTGIGLMTLHAFGFVSPPL